MSARRIKRARNRETFEITLPVRMGWLATFYYQDCTSDVGEDGDELGSISGGLGGVLGVRHKPSGRSCFIWPEDLWDALIPALTGLTNKEYQDGWEPVPEPTAADLEPADEISAKAKADRITAAKEKLQKFNEQRDKYPTSEWGRHSTVEASELKDVTFRPEAGVGFEYKSSFSEWTATLDGPRAVRLVTSSFIGSIGAIHYYSDLRIEGIIQGGTGTSGPPMPPTVSGLEIKIQKKVTRTMLADGADWNAYEVGDWTYRFETEAGAATAAREFFERRFQGDWKLTEDRISS